MAERQPSGCLCFLRRSRKRADTGESALARGQRLQHESSANVRPEPTPPAAGPSQPGRIEQPTPAPLTNSKQPVSTVSAKPLTSSVKLASELTANPPHAATTAPPSMVPDSPHPPTTARQNPASPGSPAAAQSSSPSPSPPPAGPCCDPEPTPGTAVADITEAPAAETHNTDAATDEKLDNPGDADPRILSTDSHASTAYYSAGGWSQFGDDDTWLGGRPPSVLFTARSLESDLEATSHHPTPTPAAAVAVSSPDAGADDPKPQPRRSSGAGADHPELQLQQLRNHDQNHRHHHYHHRNKQRHSHDLHTLDERHDSPAPDAPADDDADDAAGVTGAMTRAPAEYRGLMHEVAEAAPRGHTVREDALPSTRGEQQPMSPLLQSVVASPVPPGGDVAASPPPPPAGRGRSSSGKDVNTMVSGNGSGAATATANGSVTAVANGAAATAVAADGAAVVATVVNVGANATVTTARSTRDAMLDRVVELYGGQGRPCMACQVLLQYCKEHGVTPESLQPELQAREMPDVDTLTKVTREVSDCLADLAHDEGWQVVRNDDLKLMYRPLPRQGVHAFRARCVVEAPMEHMVSLVREVDLCPTWNRYCTSAAVLRERSPTDVTVYMSLWVPWPFNDVGFLLEAHAADLLDEGGRLVICFKSQDRSTTSTSTASTSAVGCVGAPSPTRPPTPRPPLPGPPPGSDRHRRIHFLSPSCMVYEPLPPKKPGCPLRTNCTVQVYVDPGVRHVPPFIISFILKVLGPFVYTAVLKVVATAFKSPDNPLPGRIQERADLYGLVRRRTEAYLRSKTSGGEPVGSSAAGAEGGRAGGGGGGGGGGGNHS